MICRSPPADCGWLSCYRSSAGLPETSSSPDEIPFPPSNQSIGVSSPLFSGIQWLIVNSEKGNTSKSHYFSTIFKQKDNLITIMILEDSFGNK